MSDYRCPYCGNEIDDPDYWEREPEEYDTFECPDCEHDIMVRYYLDPVFQTKIPEELKPCKWECDLWDVCDDCCGYKGKRNNKRNGWRTQAGLAPLKPMKGCPLGHDKEGS